MSSNLPPGCTQKDIDDHFGDSHDITAEIAKCQYCDADNVILFPLDIGLTCGPCFTDPENALTCAKCKVHEPLYDHNGTWLCADHLKREEDQDHKERAAEARYDAMQERDFYSGL